MAQAVRPCRVPFRNIQAITGDKARRITVTLSAALALYLDEYRQTHALASRSAAVAHAVRALHEKELAEGYAEYARSGEFVDLENGNGLEVGNSSKWR